MPRNRSLSNTSASSPPPALLTRGFASLRRAHRRLSNSSPSSPSASPDHSTTTINALDVITNDSTTLPRENNNSTANRTVESDSNSNAIRPRLRFVPNVGLSSRSFVFDVIDRELEPNVIYRIGRFSDRNVLSDRLSFKSKVVSRNHAELWTEQGKVYLRDIGSSSGTFLNRIRLSPPSHASAPHEIRDGDTVQLGVDYQGGLEPIYRAVRIRVEINRQAPTANNPFTRAAFQQLRSHIIGMPTSSSQQQQQQPQSSDLLAHPTDLSLHREPTKVHEHSGDIVAEPDSPNQIPLSEIVSRLPSDLSRADIQECCICLYAIAPFQALFIAPCSHSFHFKCLRPIVFQNYPGFSCPLCRSYFNLEASVAVEVDDVLEALNSAKEKKKEQQKSVTTPIDTVPELNEEEEEEEEEEEAVPHLDIAREGSLRPSSSNHSDLSSDLEEDNGHHHGEVIKTHLEASSSPVACVTTPPVPYINTPDEENEPSTSTPSQAITVNDSNHLQTDPRTTAVRNTETTLLSTTLVGSPIFDSNVLSTPTDSNA
ncbi:MAG: hypothetical protein EXX96DRAFT_540303 [Benjaminiella poitrasii]|nr:MAG: hypothetical protein EXX96DRAFT_540303 [Benjaminiella poitrasii]